MGSWSRKSTCRFTVAGDWILKMRALVIIGRAPCVKTDYENLLMMGVPEHDNLCVGIDSWGWALSNMKYFATYHEDDIPLDANGTYTIICHKQYMGLVNIIRPIDLKKEPSGSSALLGALVGIDEGYKKIILCGCPLEGKDDQGRSYKAFLPGWKYHENKLQGIVKSMSGLTRQLLGEPTIEWLNS
jgi:hypothetical protein